jgi:hypothetical protein
MAQQKKKPPAPPRQVGEFLITEAVVERRKWAKRPTANDKLILFPDGTSSDQSGESSGASPPEAPDRSAARTAAAGGDSLFQSYGHCCDKNEVDEFLAETDQVLSPKDVGDVVGREYRIRPCRCRKWFCPWCGPRQGFRLKQRLQARLASFKAIYGITLTVDGGLFVSQEEAWLYVMQNRLLARFVRELDRSGHLHSRAYFWAVEFQSETEQPHWHLLLDATFVPFGKIVEIWSRFRPQTATPLAEKITGKNYQGQAPAFGSVRFTSHCDKERAAYYATKYLTKYPQNGYPKWVLNRIGRMPRYGHSHRFFPRVSGHDPMCFCPECRGEVEPAAKQNSKKQVGTTQQVRKPGVPTSIGQRVEMCGESCSIVRVERVQLPDGTVVDGRGRFEAKLKMSFRKACELLDLSPDGRWQIELSGVEAAELEEIARRYDAGEAA